MVTIAKESDGKHTTETECYGGEVCTREHESKEKAEGFAKMCNFFFK